MISQTPTRLRASCDRRLVVITCMDSRLIPEEFLGLGIGDAEVIRCSGAKQCHPDMTPLSPMLGRLFASQQVALEPQSHGQSRLCFHACEVILPQSRTRCRPQIPHISCCAAGDSQRWRSGHNRRAAIPANHPEPAGVQHHPRDPPQRLRSSGALASYASGVGLVGPKASWPCSIMFGCCGLGSRGHLFWCQHSTMQPAECNLGHQKFTAS